VEQRWNAGRKKKTRDVASENLGGHTLRARKLRKMGKKENQCTVIYSKPRPIPINKKGGRKKRKSHSHCILGALGGKEKKKAAPLPKLIEDFERIT